jgi:hypothetical protein
MADTRFRGQSQRFLHNQISLSQIIQLLSRETPEAERKNAFARLDLNHVFFIASTLRAVVNAAKLGK